MLWTETWYGVFHFEKWPDAQFCSYVWLPARHDMLCSAWCSCGLPPTEQSGEPLLGCCWDVPWHSWWKHEPWLQRLRSALATVSWLWRSQWNLGVTPMGQISQNNTNAAMDCYSCSNFPVGVTFTQLHHIGASSSSNHRQKHCWDVPNSVMKAVPNAGRKLTLTLHWSTLIGANANNWEVMDSNWTVSAQPGGISLHQSPLSMSVDQGPIWMWLRHSVDVTLTKEAHWKLWFNDSLRWRLQAVFSAFDTTLAFKSTNWSVNVSFLLNLFCLFLSCYWNELLSDQLLISVWS